MSSLVGSWIIDSSLSLRFRTSSIFSIGIWGDIKFLISWRRYLFNSNLCFISSLSFWSLCSSIRFSIITTTCIRPYAFLFFVEYSFLICINFFRRIFPWNIFKCLFYYMIFIWNYDSLSNWLIIFRVLFIYLWVHFVRFKSKSLTNRRIWFFILNSFSSCTNYNDIHWDLLTIWFLSLILRIYYILYWFFELTWTIFAKIYFSLFLLLSLNSFSL